MRSKLLDIYLDYLICQNKYATTTGLSDLLSGDISHDKITQVLTKFFLLPKPAYTKFDRLIKKLSKFYPNFFIFSSGLGVTFLCRAEIFAISIYSLS